MKGDCGLELVKMRRRVFRVQNERRLVFKVRKNERRLWLRVRKIRGDCALEFKTSGD